MARIMSVFAQIMTCDQVARRLGCSARRVQFLAQWGHLNARRFGPMWLFDREDVERVVRFRSDDTCNGWKTRRFNAELKKLETP